MTAKRLGLKGSMGKQKYRTYTGCIYAMLATSTVDNLGRSGGVSVGNELTGFLDVENTGKYCKAFLESNQIWL